MDAASRSSSDAPRFARAAIHAFPTAGQDSESLVPFSPSGLSPADPFDARVAALGVAELMPPLIGSFHAASLAPDARVARRSGHGALASMLPIHQPRSDSAFKEALQSAFEAGILSEASGRPSTAGPLSKRI